LGCEEQVHAEAGIASTRASYAFTPDRGVSEGGQCGPAAAGMGIAASYFTGGLVVRKIPVRRAFPGRSEESEKGEPD